VCTNTGDVLVESYMGELKIASLIDSFLNLKDITTLHTQRSKYSPTSKEWNNASELKQRRREFDIALQLRNRLAKFVAGIQSETQFCYACQLEAAAIAKSEFGDSFLLSIGRTLVLQGKQYLGTHAPSKFGLESKECGCYGGISNIDCIIPISCIFVRSTYGSIFIRISKATFQLWIS
jgi:X-domain of DnaJ-containing